MSARGASKKRAPMGVRIVLLFACLVLLLAWLRHAGRWPFAGAPRTDALGPAWRAGHVYDYDVNWTGKSIARTNAAGAEGVPELIEGSLALDASVRIEALPSRGAVFPVRVALQSVDRASMVVLGQDVLSDDKLRESVLHPRTLEAEMDGAGHLVRMRLPTDTPELAAQLIEGILLELQATRARGGAYTVEERTPEGVFRVRYDRAADMLRRKRTDVVSLNGSASCEATCETTLEGGSRLRFDLEGDLAEVHDEEHTVAAEHGGAPVFQSTLRFDAALRSVTKAGAPSPLAASAGFAFKMAGDPWESAETANKLLEKRAAGITLDDVLSGLRLAGGIGPEHLPDGWIVRTAAFFELHPELLNELSVRFDDPGATQQARVTILDLLAATGTAPAQKMLRDLIGGRTTNGDANRLALVQRVTLLENPAPETVRFMRDRFDVSRASGDLHMELATAHALGSLAGRSPSETREDSRAAVTALDEAMHDAKSSEERAGLLHALGNLGDGDHVHAIAANAKDEDEDVRMAVAAALRKTPSEEAQSTLLALASDPSAGVERAALDSLGQQPLGDEVRGALGQLLENGVLSPDSEPQAVTVLLGGGPMTADVERVLRALMARTADKRLQARLRMLLANALPG